MIESYTLNSDTPQLNWKRNTHGKTFRGPVQQQWGFKVSTSLNLLKICITATILHVWETYMATLQKVLDCKTNQ